MYTTEYSLYKPEVFTQHYGAWQQLAQNSAYKTRDFKQAILGKRRLGERNQDTMATTVQKTINMLSSASRKIDYDTLANLRNYASTVHTLSTTRTREFIWKSTALTTKRRRLEQCNVERTAFDESVRLFIHKLDFILLTKDCEKVVKEMTNQKLSISSKGLASAEFNLKQHLHGYTLGNEESMKGMNVIKAKFEDLFLRAVIKKEGSKNPAICRVLSVNLLKRRPLAEMESSEDYQYKVALKIHKIYQFYLNLLQERLSYSQDNAGIYSLDQTWKLNQEQLERLFEKATGNNLLSTIELKEQVFFRFCKQMYEHRHDLARDAVIKNYILSFVMPEMKGIKEKYGKQIKRIHHIQKCIVTRLAELPEEVRAQSIVYLEATFNDIDKEIAYKQALKFSLDFLWELGRLRRIQKLFGDEVTDACEDKILKYLGTPKILTLGEPYNLQESITRAHQLFVFYARRLFYYNLVSTFSPDEDHRDKIHLNEIIATVEDIEKFVKTQTPIIKKQTEELEDWIKEKFKRINQENLKQIICILGSHIDEEDRQEIYNQFIDQTKQSLPRLLALIEKSRAKVLPL